MGSQRWAMVTKEKRDNEALIFYEAGAAVTL